MTDTDSTSDETEHTTTPQEVLWSSTIDVTIELTPADQTGVMLAVDGALVPQCTAEVTFSGSRKPDWTVVGRDYPQIFHEISKALG